MTGYHFISSTVELRLINALLSVCCDPARAMHDERDREKGYAAVVEELREKSLHAVTRLHCAARVLYNIPCVLSYNARSELNKRR